MIFARGLKKVGVFFLRDLAIARSYRVMFLFEMFETLVGVSSFYFLSRYIGGSLLGEHAPGASYFPFAVVGLAFFDYLAVALNAFEQSLEEARQNGTLEYLLVTQTSLPVILAGSAIYPFAALSLRTTVYLFWAVVLFGFPAAQANWLGAIVILMSSILAFTGLGILSTSYALLFKRGNPVKWFFLSIAGLVSGVMYPVAVLPVPLQWVARFIPVTYSLEGMRNALLSGASLSLLWPSIRMLLLFALILLPVSLWSFSWALKRTKVTGTLTHF